MDTNSRTLTEFYAVPWPPSSYQQTLQQEHGDQQLGKDLLYFLSQHPGARVVVGDWEVVTDGPQGEAGWRVCRRSVQITWGESG